MTDGYILYRGSRDELNEMCRVKDERIAELEADIAFVRAKIGEYIKSGCDPDMMAPTIDDIRHYLKLEAE